MVKENHIKQVNKIKNMTQEDKELLLKDLCARLPYGVKCVVTKSRTEEGQKGDVGEIVCVCLEGVDCIDTSNFFSEFGNFKPYLLPVSSMTKEQRKELRKIMNIVEAKFMNACCKGGFTLSFTHLTDWLNKNHIDYNGLISKGLAEDATGLGIYENR